MAAISAALAVKGLAEGQGLVTSLAPAVVGAALLGALVLFVPKATAAEGDPLEGAPMPPDVREHPGR